MPKPVLTKNDFVRRYKAGHFGNASPTWSTLEEFIDAKPDRQGLYHIRNRTAGGDTYYNLGYNETTKKWRVLESGTYYISAMAPSAKTLIQGEIQRSPKGLYLCYNKQPLPMRQGFARERLEAAGLYARGILRYYLDPTSQDWLDYLLEAYQSHVIEFSTYSIPWGTIPHVNTVWWEVRSY